MPVRPRLPRISAALAVVVVAFATALAAPAGAQYGGGGGTMTFFVSPVRVPVDQTFTGFGTGCVDGDEVEISIEGVPGVLATTTAGPPDGTFSAADIPLPDGLLAGSDHDVRDLVSGDVVSQTVNETLVAEGAAHESGHGCGRGRETWKALSIRPR